MRLEWAIMAEGVTQDARGALTVVGLAQSVLHVGLPAVVKRAVVILLSGDEEEFAPGLPITFSVRVTGPSGEEVWSHEASVPTAPAPAGDFPVGINLASEIVFPVRESGRYQMELSAQAAGHPKLETTLGFHVVAPADSAVDVARSPSGEGVPG